LRELLFKFLQQLNDYTVFLRCFRDPIRVINIENQALESAKIIIGSLESEKSGPYRFIFAT